MRKLGMFLVAVMVCGIGAYGAHAQSLAEVAKQEKEKQKDSQAKKPAKTFTNADLEKITGGRVSSVSVEPAVESQGSAAEGEKKEEGEGAKKEEEKKEEEKGEAYWRARAAEVKKTDVRAKERLTLLVNKQWNLNNDFNNTADPAQRDAIAVKLQEVSADIEEARQEAAAAAKALEDLADEGRKASALPGWLR